MAPTALTWPRFSATSTSATGAIRVIALIENDGAVKLGIPIQAASPSFVKSIAGPRPNPFASTR